ncbi:signal peptidase I [Spirochaetia bacterium]|nr:signal peptidase I [Spirochaetia bacterium]
MDAKVKKSGFFDNIQKMTEACLTRRAVRRKKKLENQKKKNPIIDWIEAFIWAACVVLLINQYLFQAYQIPSGSMIDTLLIGDRIFVNKIVYGPELLPGLLKIPSPYKPRRNQVVIFENPAYIPRGTPFDVAQRIIYMLTLSIVDIDRDENGNPKAHFLIKRAVGMGGDTFININGGMQIRFAGETRVVPETEYNEARGWTHKLSRLVRAGDYPALQAAGHAAALQDIGLNVPEKMAELAAGAASIRNPDYITFETARLETLRGAFPHEARASEQYARRLQGWYVPPGRMLPLGDNRDNSRDGRFFGAVLLDKVLGQGSFKYWPLGRIGTIK